MVEFPVQPEEERDIKVITSQYGWIYKQLNVSNIFVFLAHMYGFYIFRAYSSSIHAEALKIFLGCISVVECISTLRQGRNSDTSSSVVGI